MLLSDVFRFWNVSSGAGRDVRTESHAQERWGCCLTRGQAPWERACRSAKCTLVLLQWSYFWNRPAGILHRGSQRDEKDAPRLPPHRWLSLLLCRMSKIKCCGDFSATSPARPLRLCIWPRPASSALSLTCPYPCCPFCMQFLIPFFIPNRLLLVLRGGAQISLSVSSLQH